MSATITSFKEIPLIELNEQEKFRKLAQNERIQESFDEDGSEKNLKKDNVMYGSVNQAEVITLKKSVFISLLLDVG